MELVSGGELDPYRGEVPKGMKHVGWYCPQCEAVRRQEHDRHIHPGCWKRIWVEGPMTERSASMRDLFGDRVCFNISEVEQVPVFVPVTEEEAYEQLFET